MATQFSIPPLARTGHASHCKRCLVGLPFVHVPVDSNILAFIFYCLGSLDLLEKIESHPESERQDWASFIWDLQSSGPYGTGFKPSSYMRSSGDMKQEYGDFDTPHMIVTYTALLSLAILRDDFAQLDRPGLIRFLRSCQRPDGSFATDPTGGDTDLRLVYCALVICDLLGDWSGIDVESAVRFVRGCRTYEGGYGQAPGCEATGGPTYLALAILRLTASKDAKDILSPIERKQTLRWLLNNQESNGGFCGRTNKEADACYCFWLGASIEILGEKDLIDSAALASFFGDCQYKFGGIGKAPGEHADPYHTYLSLAALSIIPPPRENVDKTWSLKPLNSVINARVDTAEWAKQHISVSSSS